MPSRQLASDSFYSTRYTNSHAVVVGVDAYDSVGTLEYAVNDSRGVARTLTEAYRFQPENITLLTDFEATRSGVLSAFLRLADPAVVGRDDRVVFSFTGHGHTVAGRSDEVGFLVPADGTPADLSTLIRWDEITSDSDLVSAKHLFFILDSCFSGLEIPRSLPAGATRFLGDMMARHARQVLTAGKADEVVSD